MTEIALPNGLPDYPVPVLSNQMVLKMMQEERIAISHFSADLLGPTSYKLTPYKLRFNTEDEEGLFLADDIITLNDRKSYDLRPGEYAIVSPREKITVADGFSAEFFPSSWCVENKLVLTVGRLDAGYTSDLVFGVFNAGRAEVTLDRQFQLARVSFGWLGMSNMPVYKGTPPGAYIPQLQKLREREAALDEAEEELRRKREEIARLRESLLRQD